MVSSADEVQCSGANWGEVECGAIKPCKDLPAGQSEGKWVCRGGNGGFKGIRVNLQERDGRVSSGSCPGGRGLV